MAKITAPFTDEQVDALHEWQAGMVKIDLPDGGMIIQPIHPFTCCSHNDCKRLEQPNEGALIPTNDGWVCPCGKYKQDWCHDFMIKPNLALAEQPGKYDLELYADLLTSTLRLISLAQAKGFESEKDIKSFMLEPWMPIAEIFANTACVAIQWWLRTKHDIDVWVRPVVPGKYEGAIRFGSLVDKSYERNREIDNNYEMHLIGALEYALNALPPAAQEK